MKPQISQKEKEVISVSSPFRPDLFTWKQKFFQKPSTGFYLHLIGQNWAIWLRTMCKGVREQEFGNKGWGSEGVEMAESLAQDSDSTGIIISSL